MMIDETLLIVNYCQFIENESNSGSALYSIEIMVRQITIANTVFMKNWGGDTVIGGMYTTLILAQSNITNNSIKAISFTKKSNLTLALCFLAYQKCSTSSKGCFISLSLNSLIVIQGTVVVDVSSESEGGFIYLESSNLTIIYLTVMNVQSTRGACIEGTKYSNIIIKASSFQYYSPDCMYYSDSNVMMSGVTISDSVYALAKLSNIFLTGGSAVSMFNCPMIVISGCTIKNNMGITAAGGAIYIQMKDQESGMSYISDSVFNKNSAFDDGGAIYINNQNITFLRNNFSYNQAQYGGALFFDCYGKSRIFIDFLL